MPNKSRSGISRKKAATEKRNEGKTGYQIARETFENLSKHSKNISPTSPSSSPRKKARAKARASVSNRKARGLAG
jgi:hypothetical protein